MSDLKEFSYLSTLHNDFSKIEYETIDIIKTIYNERFQLVKSLHENIITVLKKKIKTVIIEESKWIERFFPIQKNQNSEIENFSNENFGFKYESNISDSKNIKNPKIFIELFCYMDELSKSTVIELQIGISEENENVKNKIIDFFKSLKNISSLSLHCPMANKYKNINIIEDEITYLKARINFKKIKSKNEILSFYEYWRKSIALKLINKLWGNIKCST